MPKSCVSAAMLPECVPGCVRCFCKVELPGDVDAHRTMVHCGSTIILELCYCLYGGMLSRTPDAGGAIIMDFLKVSKGWKIKVNRQQPRLY